MTDFWDVDAEDWDTLFSTQILKKTGIRMGERAAANTVESEGASAEDGGETGDGDAGADETGTASENA
jgi:hypothetical protein